MQDVREVTVTPILFIYVVIISASCDGIFCRVTWQACVAINVRTRLTRTDTSNYFIQRHLIVFRRMKESA